MMDAVAARVAGGETVRFRPTGSSMVPLIRSRELVTVAPVAPVDPARLEVGDIVLAKVAGSVYLHLVTALEGARADRQQPRPDQRVDQPRTRVRALRGGRGGFRAATSRARSVRRGLP